MKTRPSRIETAGRPTTCVRSGGILALLLLLGAVVVQPAMGAKRPASRDGSLPRVFLVDPQSLVETKARMMAGDQTIAAASDKLRRDADKALKAGPFSVTYAGKTPPSGDKHDYISLSRYGWPNPDTADGLPYILRDGHSNPAGDTNDYSKAGMLAMRSAVKSLAMAYYFSGQEAYAAQAAKLLRIFFLEKETRMNPHLQYAQILPGKADGRKSGIIDSRELTDVVEAIGLLNRSPSWTKADQQGMEAWFRDYLKWLLTSNSGQAEGNATNNHSVWYDVQTATFALFAGQQDVAKRILAAAPQRRIAAQIEPDGTQPLELKRTKSLSYCLFNLEAFFNLATLGDRVGVDLWNFRTSDGRSIRKTFDWILPYTVGGQKWEHEQITKCDPEQMFPLLRRASVAYREPRYEAMIGKLEADLARDRTHLLYPPLTESKMPRRTRGR